jgi:hypothetical protein
LTGGLFDMPAKESDSRLPRQHFSPETAQSSQYSAPPRIRDCERFRIDKYDPFYSIKNLEQPYKKLDVCNTYKDNPDPEDFFEKMQPGFPTAKSSPFILSDLRIRDWLIDAMFFTRKLPSHPPSNEKTPQQLADERCKYTKQGYSDAEITQIIAAGAGGGASGGGNTPKPDTVSLEVKFIIVSNGNITPTWKLVRVSANTGNSPLFGAGRTRTHDLIITIGPSNQDTANTHLASLIGNAVANANAAVAKAASQ